MLTIVLKALWEAWDVRGMLILSFILHFILFILGICRRYMVNPWISRLVNPMVWLLYLISDWVATATLGKLSFTCLRESAPAPNNLVTGFWASLLLRNLGGPDTITAYDFQDNLLWMTALLKLVFRTGLTIHVIVLSWTPSWLSFLNIPLFVAGLIKYSEKVLCLYLAATSDSSREAPLFHGTILANIVHIPQNSRAEERIEMENTITDEHKTLLGHRWFSLKRQDMKNYFSVTGSIRSLSTKIIIHMDDIVNLARGRSDDYWLSLVRRSPVSCMFDIATIERGFMFDMLYTKAAIIYTKMGSILHLISFCCSFVVLLFVSISFFGRGNLPEQYWTNIDILITTSSLAAAVVLDTFRAVFILYSDWFVVLRNRYQDVRFLRNIFKWLCKNPQGMKRRQEYLGQFNLSSYCISLKGNGWIKFLQMFSTDNLMLKFWHTSFKCIPQSLKTPDFIPEMRERRTLHFTRGEMALERYNCTNETVKETLSMDLGATIMIWHVATDMCYLGFESAPINDTIKTCKVLSDYLMYLLVIKPSMVSEGSNFWFDSFSRKLRKILKENEDISLQDDHTIYQQCVDIIISKGSNFTINPGSESSELAPYGVLIYKGIQVAEVLRETPNMWLMMKEVWLEMMHYAAMCCPHHSHLQELSQGPELLSLYWLLANSKVYIDFTDREEEEEEEEEEDI